MSEREIVTDTRNQTATLGINKQTPDETHVKGFNKYAIV